MTKVTGGRELLNKEEHDLVTLLADVWAGFLRITSNGDTRDSDLREAKTNIHNLQNAVLAQAAARAYPSEYRLLGADSADDEKGGEDDD